MAAVPPPGTGYFVAPSSGPGPGVLVISSAWGLTRSLKQRADALADLGFSVLAPDLLDGAVASDEDSATENLLAMDVNVAASLLQSSARLLQSAAVEPTDPLGILGFGAGASWALWLAVRRPEICGAVLGFYGTQAIDFSGATAKMLLHFGQADQVVTDEDVAMLGLGLQLGQCDFDITVHPGALHGFAEAEHPNFDAGTEAVAWRQSQEFLASVLRPGA